MVSEVQSNAAIGQRLGSAAAGATVDEHDPGCRCAYAAHGGKMSRCVVSVQRPILHT